MSDRVISLVKLYFPAEDVERIKGDFEAILRSESTQDGDPRAGPTSWPVPRCPI